MDQRGSSLLGWYGFRTKRVVRRQKDHNSSKNLNTEVLFEGLTEDTTVSGVKSSVTSRGLQHYSIIDYLIDCCDKAYTNNARIRLLSPADIISFIRAANIATQNYKQKLITRHALLACVT